MNGSSAILISLLKNSQQNRSQFIFIPSTAWKGLVTPYASKKIRIGFLHVATRNPSYKASESMGWYIDDVQITSPQGIWMIDFNSDGKTGLEEAIRALQITAGFE